MKRHTFILLITLFAASTVSAQNTGFLGKKFMVKTNLVNGRLMPARNLDVEYVTGRNVSINYSFNYLSFQPNTKIKDNASRYSSDYDKTSIYPFRTIGYYNTIGIRLYPDRIIPAPQGFYFDFNIGRGSAIYGYEYKREKDVYIDNYPYNNDGYYYYGSHKEREVTEGRKKAVANFVTFTFPSFGFQHIINQYLLIDTKFSFEGFVTDPPPYQYAYTYLSSNLAAARIGGFFYGPALYFKAGILIF